MAALNNLTVTDISELRSDANQFTDEAGEFQKLTQDMMNLVSDTMSSVWSGDAARAFQAKFEGLQDEMDTIFRMVGEYCTDLQTIADNYQSAEDENSQVANSLNDSITFQK